MNDAPHSGENFCLFSLMQLTLTVGGCVRYIQRRGLPYECRIYLCISLTQGCSEMINSTSRPIMIFIPLLVMGLEKRIWL